MQRLLIVCLAGAIGTGFRYGLTVGMSRLTAVFPWATLIVNGVGCFLMTFIMTMAVRSSGMSETTRLALTTGFLGGLTTYSTFNYDVTRLWLEGARGLAILDLLVTIGGCLACGALGLWTAGRLMN